MGIQLFRPLICEEAIQAVGDVLRSGWIGLGPKTGEFEHRFADFVGAPFCVGLNSCTAALHLALCVLDLAPGKEVITTPLTFVATNHAILYEHLQPVFADINAFTGNLDPSSIREKITENTGAIMVVHFAGYPADMNEISAIAQEYEIPVIEDCAHACGASYKGQRIGSSDNLHAFSFHAVKNLPMGDGGAITLHSKQKMKRLRRLRWLGIDKSTFDRTHTGSLSSYEWEYQVRETGFKYHMNDIAAVIGLHQLPLVEVQNVKRRKLAAFYNQRLFNVPGITLPQYEKDRVSSRHIYFLFAEGRNELVDKLKRANIGVGMHYRRNDHYPMYEPSMLEKTHYFCEHALSLPMHLLLSEADVETICNVIEKGW